MEIKRSSTVQVARAAGTVMVAFILSSLTGLLRQILVARAFGTGAEMEAFNAANRVSETLFNLVAGGALASAFIPMFTSLLAKGEKNRAWELASAVINLALTTLIILAAIAWLLAPEIVRYLLAPGFTQNAVKEAQTIYLLRLMLPSAILFGLSGLVMGILNCHQIFFIPAITPSMYQLGMIFGVTVLSPDMGIDGLAWGVVIGAALHLGLQMPVLFTLDGRYLPRFGIAMPEVREVIRLFAPRLLGVAVVQLNFWVNTRIASTQPEGSVTGVVLAFTLMLMPQAAIAQSFATAALPTLSSQFALRKLDEFRDTLVSSIRGILFLSLPASIGLILLREPIIELLYQRGAFDRHSTELVAWALLWYGAGLLGHCVVEILARSFYAMHDTRTPVFIGVMAMGLNVVFSFFFAGLFQRVGWMPHGGLALANSLATFLEMLGLIWIMTKRLEGIHFRSLGDGFLRAGLGGVVMALFLVFWMGYTRSGAAVNTLVGIVGGVGIYVGVEWLMKTPELRWLTGILRRKLAISK